MIARYVIKSDVGQEIKVKYKERWLADKIGLSYGYISLLISGKKHCRKRIAYSFAKAIDPEAEIEDYFDIIKEDN